MRQQQRKKFWYLFIIQTCIMRGFKLILMFVATMFMHEAAAQTQKLVTIEMYGYSKRLPSNSGFGISTYTSSPFVVKITDGYGDVSEIIYETDNWRHPIETLPCLRKEIDLWLSKGYKLFSFNVLATGETSTSFRYVVLMVKDE